MRRALLLCVAAVLVASAPAGLAATESEPRSLIVKLRAEGPHAVTECAEWAWRHAEPLVSHTSDASNSLDRLQGELGVRSVRAVFRRSDGTPFEQQRERLAARLHSRAAARGAPRRPGRQLEHVYRFELPAGTAMDEAVARFAADPHVAYAQPNHRVDLDRMLDDPFLQSQGSWGQRYPDQWGLHAIDAQAAWDRTLGEGVVVAVVDTGVDLSHPEIAPNLWVNPGEDLNSNGRIDPGERNGVDDDGNGQIDDLQGYDFHDEDAEPLDENGHGTHVAGIVAARGDNGIGIAGVAPSATILPVRVFPPAGSAETDVVWRGVLYAGLNGADIINASFSCGTICRSNPIAEDVIAVLTELGVVYVTSAGNAASDVMLKSPERLRESIVVGSIRNTGELVATSSFGLLVDVVAPGDDILSLRASAAEGVYSPNRFVGDAYMRLGGTSMATPHVSGAAALLLAADPTLSPEDVRAALRGSALERGSPGHDRTFGAGLVSPSAALDALPLRGARAQIVAPLPGDTVEGPSGSLPIVATLEREGLRSATLELGRGAEPTEWETLATGLVPGFEGREVARLSLDDTADSAYVLRLRATRDTGDEIFEFAPIALDRNPPVLVSRSDTTASAPAISGRRLAWEALEADPADNAPEPGVGLFVGRFGREAERLVVAGAEKPTDVALSGHWLAWRSQESGEDLDNAVFACREGRRSGCRPIEITSGLGRRIDLRLSGHWLAYQEAERGLFACRLRAKGCEPQPIGPQVSGVSDLLLDQRRVVWSAFTLAESALFSCVLDRHTERCKEEQALDLGPFLLPTPVALSGSLLAFTGLSLEVFTNGVFLCEIDASGSCEPVHVSEIPLATAGGFDLSGNRLVWHDQGALGQTDVFFCDYDPAARRCPVQRITHDAAHQRNPRIDATRIVWEDDRDGVQRVASFELPQLRPLRDRVVRAGERVRIPLKLESSQELVSISATLDGRELSSLDARIRRRTDLDGNGSLAVFTWRPGSQHLGVHTLRVRSSRPGGLYTEMVTQIEVRPRRRRGPSHY